MSTALEQLQYGFDRDSRRVWRQRATTQGWDNAYVYDSLGQVIGDDRGDLNLAQNAIAGIPSNGSRWQYDETGNWHGYQTLANGEASLTQSRTHDKGNRLMEVSNGAALRTDRAGRMVEAVPGPNGDWNSSWTIKWDAWSRIVELDSQGISAAYAYDGLARRITRYTNIDDATVHSYYNDEWRPVEDRRNLGTSALASYLWGSRHRDDLVRRDRATTFVSLNETRYVLMDYFSPAAITDENGDVTERYQFSAFGLRTILNPDFTVRNGSECAMEFSFQGQFEDIETGWMNYGYRYYMPALGRWACKDPIGEEGGHNLYLFSENSPQNTVDRFGLLPDSNKDLPKSYLEPTGRVYIVCGVTYNVEKRRDECDCPDVITGQAKKLIPTYAGAALVRVMHQEAWEDAKADARKQADKIDKDCFMVEPAIGKECDFESEYKWLDFNPRNVA